MTASERILAAAEHGDAAVVRELLASDASLVGAVGVHRKTPLHWPPSTTKRRRPSG